MYTDEGRVVPIFNDSLGIIDSFQYEWVMRDHLSNGRVYFNDLDKNLGISSQTPQEVLQERHYYPFGLMFEGAFYPQVGPVNEYTYNGKRFHREGDLNWYDYGARWQDPTTARWWVQDPLADSYVNITPYAYVANNPIKFVDPDGMRIIDEGQEWTAGAKFNGDENSFGTRIFNILNKLASSSEFANESLTELVKSEFDFKIELDNKGVSRFDPDNRPKFENGKASIPEPGGGTFFLNEQNPTVYNTEIGPRTDTDATVSHELIGHGIDANRGENNQNFKKGKNWRRPIPISELNASERENIIRAEMGKPLRLTYGVVYLNRWDKRKKAIISRHTGRILRRTKKFKKRNKKQNKR